MSNLIKHAKAEFRAAKWVDEDGEYTDEMQGMICDHIIKLLEVFSDEGHSGTTAPYTVNVFKKLAMFEPIVPLTGEDWEWCEVSERMGSKCWQNKRCSKVFKDEDGRAYDIEGKVFWEWCRGIVGEDDEPFKSYYTSRESRVYIEFPYTPHTEYVYKHSDATPQQPAQNESGFL